MEKSKQRILFFTPYATRTGSEMMLLYIIQNIDRNRFDVGIVSFANGELLKELPADIPVFIVPKDYNLLQKIKFQLGINPTLNYLRKIAKEFKADFWYINTMMLPETVAIAKEFSIRFITHFHELPLTYAVLSRSDIKNIIDYSDLIIGCSQVTCKAIEQAGGKNTALLYSFIDTEKVTKNQERTAEIRKTLGIPKDDYIWILSGMTSERKGFDLLPDIAEELNDPHVHLIWVGDKLGDGLTYYTEQRCSDTKSKTHIHLAGKQKDDYYNYLNAGNGFLLTSRQDPFPLVMIEAALLGKPIISFPSGGVSEFVEEGMGIVTQDLSVKQMVDAMRKVMSGEVLTNAEKSIKRAGQFNVKNGYENWIEIIDKIQ
ncbi:glycosyltransferase [Dyadobacter sp. NIV53]|uniref:glycosyltransferase n=1 Tax=Dyadobacter sp. NIV53 TaxID=2861765 RepID=UPI001C862446|nr:glycosyltransferase [Dyadobacter sp. NIV53]